MTMAGFGDVVLARELRKTCAGLFAFGSIGIASMPTGILAAAFSDGFEKTKTANRNSWRATHWIWPVIKPVGVPGSG